jgi:hypothetical protein
MNEELNKHGLRRLLLEEETCRRQVQELRSTAAARSNEYLAARRDGTPDRIELSRELWEQAKAELTERLKHYAGHSQRLIEALRADVAFANRENVPEAAREQQHMLTRAEARSNETIGA